MVPSSNGLYWITYSVNREFAGGNHFRVTSLSSTFTTVRFWGGFGKTAVWVVWGSDCRLWLTARTWRMHLNNWHFWFDRYLNFVSCARIEIPERCQLLCSLDVHWLPCVVSGIHNNVFFLFASDICSPWNVEASSDWFHHLNNRFRWSFGETASLYLCLT